MADNSSSNSAVGTEAAFMELAIELALLERTKSDRDPYGTAESILKEAIEFRKSADQG